MRKSSLKSKGRGKSENSDAEDENPIPKTEDSEDALAENGAEVSKKRNSKAGKANDSKEEEEEDSKDEVQENGKLNNKKRKKDSSDGDKKSDDEKDASEDEAEKPRGGKKSKKESKKKTAANKEEAKEEEYEVEKIVGERTVKGKRQFLVRWSGYGEDSDTWENEKELSCNRLIEEYVAEKKEENGDADKKSSPEKKSKSKTTPKQKNKKQKATKKKTSPEKNGTAEEDNEEDEGDSKEYEVEKILEVHFKKDKSREFLIRWKGFKAADDTWEPEENLNCRHLIEKFMEKVDEKKQFDTKELRVNPSHTKRLCLTMHADKRQSRRNANKERITYHED